MNDRCHGDGVIRFNPSPINDPQCEDEAKCPGCVDCSQPSERVVVEDELVAPTMTPKAAERFREALLWFYNRAPDPHRDAPFGADEFKASDHADWLRWGVGRIDVALTPSKEDADG